MPNSEEVKVSQDFNVFSGAENGILKCVSINPKANLLKNFSHNSAPLDRDQEITCLEWGQSDESELIVGLRCQKVKIFDLNDKAFSACIDVSAGSGPLRGIAKYDDALITATESGLVRLWRSKEEERLEWNTIDVEVASSGKLKAGGFESEEAKDKHLATIKAGRQLCRMRQVPAAQNLIATGGKENRLQLWDVSRPDSSPIFAAKNVKPDTLQLRVPVWVTDICFPDALSASVVSTVSRYGHIRLYDTRSNQRRPVHDLLWQDEALTSMSATGNPDQILVGSGTGNLALYDFRAQHRGMFRKYKGCVGSVRSIYGLREKPFFAVAGLDRFLRIFNISSQKAVQKMYVKSRLNCVLLSKTFEPSLLAPEADSGPKGSKRAEDIRPEVEIIGEQDDERFWAKIPVIRQKKKKAGSKETEVDKKKSKLV